MVDKKVITNIAAPDLLKALRRIEEEGNRYRTPAPCKTAGQSFPLCKFATRSRRARHRHDHTQALSDRPSPYPILLLLQSQKISALVVPQLKNRQAFTKTMLR